MRNIRYSGCRKKWRNNMIYVENAEKLKVKVKYHADIDRLAYIGGKKSN